VTAAARLADALGLRTKLLVSWGEVALEVDSAHGALIRLDGAEPTGADMGRVASVMRAIDKLAAGHLKPEEAWAEIETVSHAHPAPTWLFAIAAAAGAVALSVIFGVFISLQAALSYVAPRPADSRTKPTGLSPSWTLVVELLS
jgi:uncharacterized membrane protein YjjP (DUF1212 family)